MNFVITAMSYETGSRYIVGEKIYTGEFQAYQQLKEIKTDSLYYPAVEKILH